LIAKALSAKKSKTPFVCRGSGKPVRQFCYAPDLAKVIIWALGRPKRQKEVSETLRSNIGRELSEKIIAHSIITPILIETLGL
jgi:nucleoside-diphosphate-sugar epimerase